MGDPRDRITRADREAAEWFARLGARTIPNETLAEFEVWRRTPANIDAYNRVEDIWRSASRVSEDPEILAIAQQALDRKPARKRVDRRTFAWAGVAALGAAVATAAGLVFLQPSTPTAFSTAVGEQLPITLADGSSIRLDTDSALRVRYDDGRRVILLDRGQALFNVAHDASRPFVVQAGETSVTALGTVFDVRRADASGVRVTLVSGSVDVRDTAESAERRWRLAPGAQVTVAPTTAKVSAVDSLAETSWAQGQLVFRDTPMIDAIAEVNRYLPDKVILDAERLRDVRVNGVFNTGDRAAFVAAATDVFGLMAVPQSDGSIRLVTPT